MNFMLALAASRTEVLKTQTFTSSTTWIAPAGVTSLATLRGVGSAGTASSYERETITVSSVSRLSTQSGGLAYTRDDVFTPAGVETEKFRGSGDRTVNYERATYTVGTDDLVKVSVAQRTVRVRGDRISSSFTGGSSSSRITYNDYITNVRVEMNVRQSGTSGSATVGFGETFAGGVDGPATPRTVTNVAVTPGASYPLTIPSGGSITITYYE